MMIAFLNCRSDTSFFPLILQIAKIDCGMLYSRAYSIDALTGFNSVQTISSVISISVAFSYK